MDLFHADFFTWHNIIFVYDSYFLFLFFCFLAISLMLSFVSTTGNAVMSPR